jgi:hypothetical protein
MAELRVKGTGTLKLFESDNTSSVTIASPASLGADRTITLPDASVTLASGTMLATDGSGASLTALNASELGSGTVPTARLGSGTASSSTVLYGDQTYKAEPGGGKVLQVVNYSLTDSSGISTTSTSYVAATGVEVDITPSATSSKVLIHFVSGNTYKSSGNLYFGLYKDGSKVADIGKTYNSVPIAFHYLDSPSTTSAITYEIYYYASTGTAYLKNNASNAVILTAMEIGV